ncbi:MULTISPECIES: HigA family addiction module antitoxin [unclassified Companilactobacillus]|jgi:addiction module HigA family antidote|uniref:HigA family addiction module antitoxin n=1 Tax=unclassified Companilactobacillus TaxID=2767904 RepID=UPI002FF37CB7
MSKENVYEDLIAFHPGSYVEDIVDELNITQAEFADRLGVSAKTISKIINGEDRISNDIANKLANLTGISIKTWMNLQEAYDIKFLEIENKKTVDKEENVCRLIDFGYFKKNHLVRSKKYSIKDKVDILHQLLNVSSLSNLESFNPVVSYRNTKGFEEKSIINSNVMLELAMNEARNVTDVKYTKSKLNKILPIIREMSLDSPEVFYPKLKELLLGCGIVLVGLPNLKNAYLNGATKKFKNGSVLLLITDRNKYSDVFWFSLVHELGHIYFNDFYSNYENEEEYQQKEDRADKFAADFFIPQDMYSDFVNEGKFDKKSILNFAKILGINPSIIVGRLQKEKFIDYKDLQELKTSYSIVM